MPLIILQVKALTREEFRKKEEEIKKKQLSKSLEVVSQPIYSMGTTKTGRLK